jgi:hypothetical protein
LTCDVHLPPAERLDRRSSPSVCDHVRGKGRAAVSFANVHDAHGEAFFSPDFLLSFPRLLFRADLIKNFPE